MLAYLVAFDMYDLDHNGVITKDEMLRILESFFKLVGPLEDSPLASFSGKKYETPQDLVDDFFEQMDEDGDGKISLSDYQDGAARNPDIIQGLKLFSNKTI